MTASSDVRYGRQGGRLVGWVPPEPTVHVGDVVALTPLLSYEPFVEVEVVQVLPGGRALIRFESGSSIVVDTSRLHPSEDS